MKLRKLKIKTTKGSLIMYNIKFLNTKDVAKVLNCSVPTARHLMMRADFPLIKVGKNLKVEEQAFIEWANKRRV